MTDLTALRVATGFDAHPLVEGRKLVLGGVEIEHDRGLEGHSDGDVVAHAVTDGVLGVAGSGDIGTRFPSSYVGYEGADSMQLLRTAAEEVADRVTILSVDVTIAAQAPYLAPHRLAMVTNIANNLGIDGSNVSLRGTTTDHLGFVGRGEGIAVIATVLGLRSEAATS
jgi:2-C-methyl-D-erythritol 2,4-cyclodiphosphate synthase